MGIISILYQYFTGLDDTSRQQDARKQQGTNRLCVFPSFFNRKHGAVEHPDFKQQGDAFILKEVKVPHKQWEKVPLRRHLCTIWHDYTRGPHPTGN